MPLIYTPEAQYFVTAQPDEKNPDRIRLPMLGFFMSAGTGLLSGHSFVEQKTIASQFMSKVDARHARILKKLRPFLFNDNTGLFDGLDGLPTHDDHLVLSRLVLPAINLVEDFDILVALVRRYPDVHADAQQVIESSRNDVFQAIKSVNGAARSINSGRLFGAKDE